MLRAQLLRRESLHVRAGPRSMVPGLGPVTESFRSVENATTQQPKPSVTWDLSSPSAQAAAAQATTSSGAYPRSASRRDGPGNRPEINVGAQPQICFLQPRTSQPLVLFRCGAGAQCVDQPELPQTPARSAGPWNTGPGSPRAQPFLRPPGESEFHTDRGPSSFAVRLFAPPGAREPGCPQPRRPGEAGILTCNSHSSELHRPCTLPGLTSCSPVVPSALWAES